MVKALDERYAAMILLAAWCALRFGELSELRRGDIDLDDGLVHVRRGAQYVCTSEWGAGTWYIGEPKSAAGKRTVSIPPHLLPVIRKHLDEYTGKGPDALLWTATTNRPGTSGAHDPHLTLTMWRTRWHKARAAADRDDMNFHDLRHTGATLAAASGATIKEPCAGSATPPPAPR